MKKLKSFLVITSSITLMSFTSLGLASFYGNNFRNHPPEPGCAKWVTSQKSTCIDWRYQKEGRKYKKVCRTWSTTKERRCVIGIKRQSEMK